MCGLRRGRQRGQREPYRGRWPTCWKRARVIPQMGNCNSDGRWTRQRLCIEACHRQSERPEPMRVSGRGGGMRNEYRQWLSVGILIGHGNKRRGHVLVGKGGETMRVSDIANWAACEAMALHSPPRQAGRTNVAAWVGTMAHAILAGQPVPPTGGRIAYDQLTPTEHVAHGTGAVSPATPASSWSIRVGASWGKRRRWAGRRS